MVSVYPCMCKWVDSTFFYLKKRGWLALHVSADVCDSLFPVSIQSNGKLKEIGFGLSLWELESTHFHHCQVFKQWSQDTYSF